MEETEKESSDNNEQSIKNKIYRSYTTKHISRVSLDSDSEDDEVEKMNSGVNFESVFESSGFMTNLSIMSAQSEIN